MNTHSLSERMYPSENEVPKEFRVPRVDGRILIGGKIQADGFETKQVLSPCAWRDSGGKLVNPELGRTPDVSIEKFLEAVDSAAAAWAKGGGEWATARMEDRINAIAAFRDRMLERRDIIAKTLMWEIAKTWPDAQAEFDRTIIYINDTIEAAKNLDREGSRIQFAGGIMAQIRRAPLGVTLCMGPFNYPLNETFCTLIPALIMGNSVVVKIPRFGQLIWEHLLEAFRDCFPAGVVNVVNGLGRKIVAPAVKTGKIDVLAFIGSSPVANQIKLAHPEPHHFRSILGLDAKNPAIILKDADLDVTVSECVKGSLSFNGQRCTAIKFLFVEKPIAKEFTERFVAAVEALKCGMPWEPGTFITPLPDFGKPEQLKTYVAEAVKGGAKLANPGRGGQVAGSLFAPAVVTDVPLSSRLATEEQFGPVIPIVEFQNRAEIEEYMVNSPFGMQASLFGQNPAKVGHMIDILANQVCRINLNSQCQRGPDVFPFTGRKRSAEGTLSVTDALRSFSIRSMVAAKHDPKGKAVVRGVLESDSSRFLSTNIVL